MNYKNMKLGLISAAAIFISTNVMANDPVKNAFILCQSLDNTGMLSEPCKVSGWNSSIDLYIETNGSEARKICSGIVSQSRKSGLAFDSRWKVRVFSPFSNGKTIAQCAL